MKNLMNVIAVVGLVVGLAAPEAMAQNKKAAKINKGLATGKTNGCHHGQYKREKFKYKKKKKNPSNAYAAGKDEEAEISLDGKALKVSVAVHDEFNKAFLAAQAAQEVNAAGEQTCEECDKIYAREAAKK